MILILERAARVVAAALVVALFVGRLRKPEASDWRQSQALLRTRHAVVLDEIFPGQCHQLPFSGMVDGFPAHDLLEKRGAVLPDIVSKAGLRLMRADHQHVGDAGQDDRLFQLQPLFPNASSSLPSKFPTFSSSGPSSSFHLTVRSSFSDTLFSTFHFIFHFLSSPPATSTCFNISFNFHSCLPASNLSFISYQPSVFLFSRQPAVHGQPGPAYQPPSRPPVTSF